MPSVPVNYGLPTRAKKRAAIAVQIQEVPATRQPAEVPLQAESERGSKNAAQSYEIPHDPVTGEVIGDEPSQDGVKADSSPEEQSKAVEPKRSSQQSPAWRRFQAALGDSTALQLFVAGLLFGAGLIVYNLLQSRHPAGSTAISQGLRASAEFPQVDLGQPQRVTLTEDDVNRILSRDVRVAPRPGVDPSVAPFANKKGAQTSAPREKVPGGNKRQQARREVSHLPDVVRLDRPGEIATPTFISESFYGQGGSIEVVKPMAANARLGLPPGSSIPVKLQIGVSSAHPNIVLAQVTADVDVDGKRVLAVGDVLKGRPSSDSDRIYIDFYEVSTSSRKSPIAAYAIEDGSPGIVANKRTASSEERAHARAANGAVEVAKGVANTAAAAPGGFVGQVGARIASNVGNRALAEIQRDMQPADPSVVLQAPKGKEFHVVVTGE